MVHNKYRVAPKEERTFNGVAYHSKAECLRAQEHDLVLRAGQLLCVVRQPLFVLGDITYRPDFLLVERLHGGRLAVWVEDIKGVETPRFKLVKRIWAKYQKLDLLILTRDYRKRAWNRETIRGGEK